jgi:NAD(P)-dependent dehydrogenase (short-subunit alcohol dehydrogenase family)
MARRVEKLTDAAKEAGPGTLVVGCDVTDPESVRAAIDEAVAGLGGIDALVYTPGVGPLARIAEVDVDTWRSAFDTNVVGAAVVASTALPHLKDTSGSAVFLSTVSASVTPPWPGLGAYAVTKAAMDKLVEAYRAEHPQVGFTRVVVGDCAGGEGDGMTQFANSWDPDLAMEMGVKWVERKYLAGTLMDVEELVRVVDTVLRLGASACVPTVTVAPRPAE